MLREVNGHEVCFVAHSLYGDALCNYRFKGETPLLGSKYGSCR